MQDANQGHKRWLRSLRGHSRPVNITIPVTVPIDVKPSDVPVIAKADQPKSMIVATGRMAWASIAMVVVALATLGAALLQWQSMDDQIEQMKVDNGVMKDQLKYAQDQIELAKKQLKQNEDVLDQMRLEQRAWVGLQRPRFEDLVVGKPLRWWMNLSNSGQTPALVERIEYNVARRSSAVVFDPATVALVATAELQQSLAPGAAPTGLPFTINNIIVDQALLDFIRDASARDRVYIFGRIHYEDVAGKKRDTEFAFVNKPGSFELRLHHKHNRMR